MKDDLVIGVVGTLAAGKDAVSQYLVSRGFHFFSGGDYTRQYIREYGLGGLDRDNLQRVANELRRKHGADYMSRVGLETAGRPLVISGARTPAEVEIIKRHGGYVIAVDAPVERRYAWAKARGRIDDAVTTEEFKRLEAAEATGREAHTIQLESVIAMADFSISNDGTQEELQAKVDEVLRRIGYGVPAQPD